ncbi:carbohydrate esterase family 9 protein [Gymnopilus junonius]|uniref:Carbohydrate esterase family 9 protein n=1 Tax=Gymnopilus junonius TaxID=109634 RepID=A0A9P5NM07_GYMJU|nr:carbohydrate esterase family 9 protein [Gymnopilus junonius]
MVHPKGGEMGHHSIPSRPKMNHLRIILGSSLVFLILLTTQYSTTNPLLARRVSDPLRAAETVARCRQLALKAGPPPDFHDRTASDRFEQGTRPTLIKNAKIWTGKKNGTEVLNADILLDKGLIKGIGHLRDASLRVYGKDLDVVDARGSWVTPGIVDVHSHLGDASSPALSGAEDDNSLKDTAQPWLRSLDGLNTHDDSYPLSIAGGVTTSLVLPGSANAIGGQAFVIKLRETKERSPSSMLLEPPYNINISFPNPNSPPRWRHMKHACGENPSSVYADTRMDTIWAFRQAYNTAKQIKERQDEYCSRVLSNDWTDVGDFPESLQWEALVDVLRGKVKVNTHCYEAVDLDALVRISNEFKFPIAAFHHASEAYLVPDLLKKAYGKPPAIALFATNSRYKREAYRGSEFAPRILAENGLTVLMKSDHPVLNSRYLLYEAQQAHFYGLPANLAIASVTSNSAEVMGIGHRIGYLAEGYDADIVIWDSHPLALGATPTQVFIDGIAQLESPYAVNKPDTFQKSPKVPNFDEEAKKAVLYEGLPPLAPKLKYPLESTIVFTNVTTIHLVVNGAVKEAYGGSQLSPMTVVARNGLILCYGHQEQCPIDIKDINATYVDLEGGSISPGLVSFGSPLGLQHIDQEPSTNDGFVFEPLRDYIPDILGGYSSIIRAVDGLEYGTRDALLAYRSGVTIAVTAPSHNRFFGGLGTSFSLGASHKLEEGAIVQAVTAVHMSIRHSSKLSVSTQIAALRRLLLGSHEGDVGDSFKDIIEGRVPLVVEAHSADVIATLIALKKQVEVDTGKDIRLTISGGAEAHLLAKELGEANVGVVLTPSRPFPYVWEDRRILPGPPLSNNSAIMELISNNVVVGIGCEEIWSARNLPFDVAWAAIESGGRLSKELALAIGSTNVLRLLGVSSDEMKVDMVATRGGDILSLEGKVAAILSPGQRIIHLFDEWA